MAELEAPTVPATDVRPEESTEEAPPAEQGSRAAAFLLGLGIAVHLLFLLSLRFGWLNPLFNDTMHRFGPGGDFFSLYAAGVKARAGESVYTIGGHVETVPYAYAFRYAPLVAYTLGAALSFLPAIAAYALWLIACELALLRNIRRTLEIAPDKRTGYVAAALWLLFTPYYLELFVGQFTFITASLVFWAYLDWQKPTRGAAREAERGKADGFWMAAVWLKMMPLLYLPIVLLRGRWKSALVALLVLAASSAVYFMRFPSDWTVFADTNAVDAPAGHAGNLGLMALLYHAAHEQKRPFLIAHAVVLTLAGLSLAWLTYRTWEADKSGSGEAEGRRLALYVACSAVYLLAYKDVWEHHYVLLLPPLVLLALRKANPWLWLPLFLLSALPGLFALYDLPGLGYNEDPQVYWRPATSLLHHAPKPLAPLWLLTGLLVQSFALPEWKKARPHRRQTLQWAMSGLLGLGFLGGMLWARTVINEQRRMTLELVWPPSVFQKQETLQTCGPAALAAICRHYGLPATEAEIAHLAGTTSAGTSMLGLQSAARAKGLAAEGMRMTLASLPNAPRPCLLFFRPGHFAVLTGVGRLPNGHGELFYLADPSLGQRTMTADRLGALWHGEVLVVGPTAGSHASTGAP
jgi:hypothetical protein